MEHKYHELKLQGRKISDVPTSFFIDIIDTFKLADIIFLIDENGKEIKGNVRGILELSKALLARSIQVRYLHAHDLEALPNDKSNKSHSINHNHLNVSNIDSVVQKGGSKKDNSLSKVEDLTTKSAFFVISETTLVQDIITYVSHKTLD